MPPGVRQAEFEPESEAEGALRNARERTLPRRSGGHYRLNRLLHRGRSSVVWHAVRSDGTEFAIKFAIDTAASAVERLRSEYELLTSLTHPYICRAEEWLDSADGMVLEYLPGGDLVSLAGGPPAHWVRALGDLAAALAFLHDRGLVHRDVKARNVSFDSRDRARLMDLGSCRAIGSPWSVGGTTAEHRPPGWVGRTHTAGDDVYAFAVLCHEMIYGALPTESRPLPLPPGTRRSGQAAAALDDLVRKTLESNPGECDGSLHCFSSVLKSLMG